MLEIKKAPNFFGIGILEHTTGDTCFLAQFGGGQVGIGIGDNEMGKYISFNHLESGDSNDNHEFLDQSKPVFVMNFRKEADMLPLFNALNGIKSEFLKESNLQDKCWYWVKRDIGSEIPAVYDAETKHFTSTTFSGVPASEITVVRSIS